MEEFFFNDTATTEIYALSLHDALPIYFFIHIFFLLHTTYGYNTILITNNYDISYSLLKRFSISLRKLTDRKSTRLNSSHANISYAVFCLKKNRPAHPLVCPVFSRSGSS